ncbi:MAG TPA: protein kinase [Longimicrobiaceae bacterium]|nr:protein kinase [Longimicrobiaceae bacterium]
MAVRLFTFGCVALERDGTEVSGDAVQPRRLALLALLTVAGEAGLMREKVLGYLWPDHPSPRSILNESLFVLRAALGKSVVLTVGDALRLNAREVWTDVAAFQERLAAGALREAVELYRGPFLDGFYVRAAADFEQWVGREQDRMRRDAGRALETLAEQAAAAGDRVGAADWWERLARHEEFNTRVALRCVEALVRAGEPVRAMRFATEFSERMRRELGVAPDPAVEEYARAVIAGLHDPAPEGAERGTPLGAGRPGAATGGPPGPGTHAPPSYDGLEGLDPDLEVVELVGEGSVARVYLARERTLRRQVAVKVLSPRLSGDRTASARFEREALAAAGIQHPNVAPIYRTGWLVDGIPYLVMPYFHGGSLQARLAAGGPLPLEEARRYLGQIAAGLAAAHRLGTVHRDVRPANILYDPATHRVVLIDFGIAAVRDQARITLPGERLGNPVYASPEQLHGDDVTDRADVYSLGVVAFEMLTGRLPFDAATPVQMMRAHAVQTPLRARELRPDVDPELNLLIARCLGKLPEERPTAADVAEAVVGR